MKINYPMAPTARAVADTANATAKPWSTLPCTSGAQLRANRANSKKSSVPKNPGVDTYRIQLVVVVSFVASAVTDHSKDRQVAVTASTGSRTPGPLHHFVGRNCPVYRWLAPTTDLRQRRR